jgi:hypothetical protein
MLVGTNFPVFHATNCRPSWTLKHGIRHEESLKSHVHRVKNGNLRHTTFEQPGQTSSCTNAIVVFRGYTPVYPFNHTQNQFQRRSEKNPQDWPSGSQTWQLKIPYK